MATTDDCARCHRPGQATLVLGVDICARCANDLKRWLSSPVQLSARHGCKVDRRAQAEQLLSEARTITADEVARINGEKTRIAYWGLMHVARAGAIVHLGLGVFAMSSPLLEREIAAYEDAVLLHTVAGASLRQAAQWASRFHHAPGTVVYDRLQVEFGQGCERGRPRKYEPIAEAAE